MAKLAGRREPAAVRGSRSVARVLKTYLSLRTLKYFHCNLYPSTATEIGVRLRASVPYQFRPLRGENRADRCCVLRDSFNVQVQLEQ